jgi:CubicO group peptidase (beta-lactamase class C family)
MKAQKANSMRRRLACTEILVGLIATLLPGLALSSRVFAGPSYPGISWTTVKPEDRSWSSGKLNDAWLYAQAIGSGAVLVVDDGVVVGQWGSVDRKWPCYAIRRGFLNALCGIAVADGQIDLEKNLDQLGIDDLPPRLSAQEKQASVLDLLKCRSGIYHTAAADTPEIKEHRPKPGSHLPGTFWFYNNWDINALGTLYEQATKQSVFTGFDRLIALPLQMEDFDPAHDTRYFQDPGSLHPADMFRMSSRDLARFGLLYLRHGTWAGNKQIVPAGWIDQSIHPYSQVGSIGGFGYLWWTALNGDFIPFVDLGDDAFGIEGSHGHYLVVAPALHLVVVQRCADDSGIQDITRAEFGRLLELVLSARTNAPSGGEVPGAGDADPRFAGIAQKAVRDALDGKIDAAAYAPKLRAKLIETPAWKRLLEYRETIRGQSLDALRIYRVANYEKETYYYLEVLAGNRPLAIRCGLDQIGQIIYLNTIE